MSTHEPKPPLRAGEERAPGPPRPLLWAGLALAAGSALALALPPADGARGAAALVAVLLGCLVLAWRPARGRARRAFGIAGDKAWLAVLVALGGLRGLDAARVVGGDAPAADLAVGRFRAASGDAGWLELGGDPHERLRLDLVGGAPVDGEWIAIPRGGQRVPWPRGPAPGALAREFPDGARVLLPDEVLRLEERGAPLPSPSWIAGGRSLRERIARRLDAELEPGTAPFARAVLLGDREGLDPELADLFTRTGTRHLLAVSGLHVALFAALLPWPLAALVERRTGRRGLALAVRAGGIGLFLLVAGGRPPVHRAALALALAALAPHLPGRRSRGMRSVAGRRPDALSLWGVALALEVLGDPQALRSLSVQLSYAATLGILVATAPLARWIARRVRSVADRDPLAGGGTGLFDALRARGRRVLSLGLAASASAVLATLPVAWWRFGEVAPVGVLLTPLVAPLFALAMLATWSVAVVPTALGAQLAEGVAHALFRVLELADRLPATPLPLPERPAWLVGLASAAVLAALARRSAPLARAGALAFGILLLPWSARARELEVHALDVGHGTAVVVRAPGLAALVFDAGSRQRRRVASEALLPLLARWEVARPLVVLSHDDRDHASGLARLVERHPPTAWLGALPRRIARRLPGDCARLDADRGGLGLRVRGGLEVELLRGSPSEDNEGSRSLALRAEGRRVLLCGDAEEHGLARVLRERRVAGPVELLLFPHHGSDTPWLGALLGAARPREVWISGPRPELAAELDRRGLRWRCTGTEGPLSFRGNTAAARPGGGRVKRPAPARLALSREGTREDPLPGSSPTLGVVPLHPPTEDPP